MCISRYPLIVQLVVRRHSIFRILRLLPGLMALLISATTRSAEPDTCSPREWAISLVDPNVLDADSYTADTSLLIDHAGRPRIFYARGPVNGEGWRIKSAIERA